MKTLRITSFLAALTLAVITPSLQAALPFCGPSCSSPLTPVPMCAPAYNPPAYCLCEGGDSVGAASLSGRFDVLWWRACEEGISLGTRESFYGFTTRAEPSVRERVYNNSRIKNLHTHYDPGFRLGANFTSLCKGCDAAILWTHFHTSGSAGNNNNCCQRGTTFLVSAWERLGDIYSEKAKASWKLEMDMIDLEFGSKFYASSCFVIRPLIGIRVARIDQSYRTNSYSSDSGLSNNISQVFVSRTKSNGCFMALGPRAGVHLEYRFDCGLTLFGEAASSILFGRFNRHANERSKIYFGLDSFEVDYDYHSSTGCDKVSRTFADISLGLNYSRCFEWCHKVRKATLSISWEHHAFYHLNSFNFATGTLATQEGEISCSGRKYGNLYTQGLVVSAEVGF